MQEHVYFIREVKGGPIKIGRTGDLQNRYRTLQTGTWRKLELLRFIPWGGRKLERDLHKRFSHLRVVNEWFRDAPELMEYVLALPVHDPGSVPTRDTAEYARSWRASKGGLLLAQRRREYRSENPLEPCICPVCREKFIPSRSDRRVCSRKCRDHKSYLERKARKVAQLDLF